MTSKVELPSCGPMAAKASTFAALPFQIDPSLTASLRLLAGRERTTLFVVMVAALKGLVARYSGASEVSLGSAGGRVWRTETSHGSSLRELLARAVASEKTQALATSAPQILVLQGARVGDTDRSFDWALSLGERGESVEVEWHFETSRFDTECISRAFDHWTRLLESFARDGDATLASASLLSQGERDRILTEWNATERPFRTDTLIHELFEEQAARDPNAVALVCANEEIAYGALDARATKLARHLRAQGVGPGKLVGVCLDRSIDLVVAVLAVTKAGGAYVPVDPAWPFARMRQVLASSELATVALVTDRSRVRVAYDLQWDVPTLRSVVLVDVTSPKAPCEAVDEGAVRSLWDHVAEAATDRVSAAGFIRSRSGATFGDAEVDEYRDWVISRVEPWITPQARVLEIGCGSGLIAFALAPRVGTYLGLDPSEATQKANREACAAAGLTNLELRTSFAHEISALPASSFDLVLLPSVIQFFPGPMYLESILASALRLVAPGGAVVVADVLDPKHRAAQELHVAPEWFAAFAEEHADVAEVVVHRRTAGFENELRHRYDVVIRRARAHETRAVIPADGARSITTAWHVDQCPTAPLERISKADDPAYVIYTSGSTGAPKGVVVRHRPAVNLIEWVNTSFDVGPRDRLLFVASICFDLSVYDVFGMLGAGGSLRIAERAELRDPERLADILASGTITFWDSAPAALQQLKPFFPREAVPGAASLRLVFMSGDWIPVNLPDAIRASFPNAAVISLGGATEATVWSNFFPIGSVDPAWLSIPYGKPIQNAKYHVLDASMQPCPVGVRGDLYIGGGCLASGYIDDPSLTGRKFVQDPYSREANARLYKTGDLARYWPDGNLEFLGRADHQVKIRGFRIELGEIESVLLKHPGVREVVVCVREDVPGDRRIVAYYVARGAELPADGELAKLLGAHLPEYMMPSAYVALDVIPITSNGKVARDQLPAPTREGSGNDATALTPVESTLALIWEEVLGVARVGRDDNFFDLGGHSMILAETLFKIEGELGVKVPFREAFLNPTVGKLAKVIEARSPAASTGGDYRHAFDLQVGDELATFEMSREDFERAGLPEGALNARVVHGTA